MDRNKYMIGVDIGTTSTKAVLFRETGEIISQDNNGYELYTPDVSTAEQDPEEIFQAVLLSITNVMQHSQIDPKDLSFISFSSAMHSVIAIDEKDKPLTRCITWADNRSSEWAKKIKDKHNGHEIYLKTGTPIHPMSPLCKIAWMEHEKPNIARKTKKYIGIKEYVFYKFFNEYVVDYSIASAMGLMNLQLLAWEESALEIANITEEKLSRLVSTKESFTGCHPEFAQEMGILESTRFVIGASDGVLSNIGVNAIKEGDVAVTIGTSGAIRTVIPQPRTDSKGRIFCYALTEDHWVIGGPVNNGGLVLRWIRDELAASEIETAKRLGIDPYDVLTRIAERVNPGANGLLFHPYLAGERAPLWNSDVRGSFIGLTLNHKKEHMIRAALEGVIFNLYTVFLALTEVMDTPVTSIKATGGFARSKVWRQMMADIFDHNVIIPESYESSCLGACLLGLYAEKKIDSFEVFNDLIGATYTHQPNPENKNVYRELIPIFINISRQLESEYQKLSAFQKKESNKCN
ncbi:gluconate kinase [Virgibacillus pantothenticus]|uniref:Gluconokinase n=1 Tax=Virgibacillus pantothenticus TaxID=1473 RepID=A0A0L0QJW2_VIRPA|nr:MULTISPECIES: gluconokinase [Virgibacillus]API92919.1 gluconokinase [Virgibacillus sp. 6R]KNE18846.1 gluconokinase [Virgibacillus pantothenticus]MBS7428436.1 gluconokinase [Virgibacillus sp. 19R1-5]MBU8568286.1 gluconokinase [Virgibacillus pantothenticus]MBU8602253.1 gluconokinase [Virgibacillus pantothenticus]